MDNDEFSKNVGNIVISVIAVVIISVVLALGFRLVRWIVGF